jgi:hypothetical protein
MRSLMVIPLLLAIAASVDGQAGDKTTPQKRFGIELNTKNYPQATPKEGLESFLKALGEKEFRYMMAYLADPAFVDKRVTMFMAEMNPQLSEKEKKSLSFDKLVQRTTENFEQDPTKIKELQRFLKDGDWEEGDREAVAKLKNIQTRKVFMKKVDYGWVLQDREK